MRKLYRGTIHWSAGGLKANAVDRKHYHVIVQDDGSIVFGDHTPEDNINCQDDDYATHCAYANTGNIGITVCGGPAGHRFGEFTAISFERACEQAAKYSIKYDIPVENWKTHYERDRELPANLRSGKIDITQLPHHPEVPPEGVGDLTRRKIAWYRQRLISPPLTTREEVRSPVPDDGAGDKVPIPTQETCTTCGKTILNTPS